MANEMQSLGIAPSSGKTTELRPRFLQSRIWEPQLIDIRGWRLENFLNWKARLRTIDSLYRGDWSVLFPDDMNFQEAPIIMNLVQTQMDDLARLSSESLPSTSCPPTKETEAEEKAARIRQGIAYTYGEVNKWDLISPRLVMDLAGSGTAFVVVTKDPDSTYPCWYRIDPRKAYPDVWNGVLQDLLVVSQVRYRQAARIFPNLELPEDPESTGWVEILEYYSKDECLQAVYRGASTAYPEQAQIVKRWYPGKLPVAFAQLPSFDGAFRGMFDQVAGSLAAKNRLMRLIIDYADRGVYSPLKEKGLLNREDPEAPGTMYHLDPNVEGADVGRVQAPESSPQIYSLLEFLDREQRAGVGYPSSRGGELSQSIASASFVASTQGQLTSTVRMMQRLTGDILQQLNTISFCIDEKFADEEKPLISPVEKKVTYKPSVDIAGIYENTVVYGAGAGLDRTQADVRILQHLGANLIDHELAREQIDYIRDPTDIPRKIAIESAENVLLQQLLSSGDMQATLVLLASMSEGKSLSEAAKDIVAAQQAAQAAQAPAAAAQAPAPPGGPLAAQGEQQALAAGGKLPQPGAAFAPPPLEQVTVRPPSAGRPVQQR